MTLDYFYGAQADQFAFYRIPKALFTDERFKSISAEAKILYGIRPLIPFKKLFPQYKKKSQVGQRCCLRLFWCNSSLLALHRVNLSRTFTTKYPPLTQWHTEQEI